MRPVVLLPLLAGLAASAATARADELRESRYGPRSARAQAAVSAATSYQGPMLSWAGKAAPPPERAFAERPLAERPAQPALPLASAASSRSYAPPPTPRQTTPPPQALPTSLYSPPIAAAPMPAPAAPPLPARTAGPLPWNQRPDYLQSQAQSTTPRPAPRAAEGLTPRTYSVGRMFGLTPDPIAAPGPDNRVLMAVDPGEPGQARASADLADDPLHGSAEWLAQAAREAGRTPRKPKADQDQETQL